MKVFISYKFTGERIEDLRNLLIPVQEKLRTVGVDAYCNLFDPELEEWSRGFKAQDYVFRAFKELNSFDLLFVVINSEEKSEGMIMELAYSIAKNIPVVVAIRSDIKNTYLPGMANMVIEWSDLNDLLEKISNADFNNLKK